MSSRDEEKVALLSIYEDIGINLVETETDLLIYKFNLTPIFDGISCRIYVNLFVGETYPMSDMPGLEIKGEKHWLKSDDLNAIKSQLLSIYESSIVEGQGQVILFEFIEHLRSFIDEKWKAHVKATNVAQAAPEDNLMRNNDIEVLDFPVQHSKEPLVDRKSIFVAHLAPVDSVGKVQKFLKYLLSNSKIERATHNIMAYRFSIPREHNKMNIVDDIILQDCDDDGETAAGGRLLKLLENCKCVNVAVVVSRWYGGVKLGPDRFKNINTVARDLLQEHGFVRVQNHD
jgi:hypothetical protein